MRWRVVIARGSFILYAIVFIAIYPSVGVTGAVLNSIPAIAFGWFFGVRGGLTYGLLTVPVNFLVFQIVGAADYASSLLQNLVGGSALTLVSLGVGWVRDLSYRVQVQANELGAERKLLQEEIVRRTVAEERLVYETLHDPLTNLANRKLFYNRLEHAIEWSKRNPDNICAVLYLDLNRFKDVNDSLGHEAGDQLLIEVASRLKSSVRVLDTVARMGGDEFSILLEDLSGPVDVFIIIHRMQTNLAIPYECIGHSLVIEPSIGVVINIAQYEGIDGILSNADAAMYEAKAIGGSAYRVFDARLAEHANRKHTELEFQMS